MTGDSITGHLQPAARADYLSHMTGHTRRICGARTRRGTICKALAMRGKARCKTHGGKNTGPSPAGRERIAEANSKRPVTDRMRAALAKGTEAASEARGPAKTAVVALPAEVDLSDASALRRLTRLALQRTKEVMEGLYDTEEGSLMLRAAGLVLTAQIKVDDQALRETQRVDRLMELLEALKPGLSAGLLADDNRAKDGEGGDGDGSKDGEDGDI